MALAPLLHLAPIASTSIQQSNKFSSVELFFAVVLEMGLRRLFSVSLL
jgi:hypothetical protein